jgi:hypothetical protein
VNVLTGTPRPDGERNPIANALANLARRLQTDRAAPNSSLQTSEPEELLRSFVKIISSTFTKTDGSVDSFCLWSQLAYTIRATEICNRPALSHPPLVCISRRQLQFIGALCSAAAASTFEIDADTLQSFSGGEKFNGVVSASCSHSGSLSFFLFSFISVGGYRCQFASFARS